MSFGFKPQLSLVLFASAHAALGKVGVHEGWQVLRHSRLQLFRAVS